MSSVNLAPTAQPASDQPKVVRDDSSGSAFQDTLEDQVSSGAGDSQQASANDADARPATEKPKKDTSLEPSVIVAILSAMTPVIAAASFGSFSAGDMAGAPAAGKTEDAPDAETLTETPAALPLTPSAPTAEEIASDPSAALAFAMRLVDLTPDRTPVPIVDAGPAQPENVALDVARITPQPIAALAPVEPNNKPAPVSDKSTTQVPQAQAMLGQKPAASAPEQVIPLQSVQQESRNPDRQSGEQRHHAEPHAGQPESGQAAIRSPQIESSRTDQPRLNQPRVTQPALTPGEPSQPRAAAEAPGPLNTTPITEIQTPMPFAVPTQFSTAISQDSVTPISAPTLSAVEHTIAEPPVRPSATSTVTDISITLPMARMNAAGEGISAG